MRKERKGEGERKEREEIERENEEKRDEARHKKRRKWSKYTYKPVSAGTVSSCYVCTLLIYRNREREELKGTPTYVPAHQSSSKPSCRASGPAAHFSSPSPDTNHHTQ